MRLFFATDIHGSDVCFRKFLRTPEFYGVDALFLGGDYSSKSLVICIRKANSWHAIIEGEQVALASRRDVLQFQSACWNRGQLFIEVDPDEFQLAQKEAHAKRRLYDLAQRTLLMRWTDLATDRLHGTHIPIYHVPGNDDPGICDSFFRTSPFIPCDRRHIQIDPTLALLGLGGSTPTPWDTPREYSEEQLVNLIQSTINPELLDVPLIFFVHVPPWDSGLDLAPALRDDLSYKMVFGSPQRVPVGSKAVRAAVMRYQPILGLFGHVHESRGRVKLGRTLCLNPGSAYSTGQLLGCIVAIKNGRVTEVQMTEG